MGPNGPDGPVHGSVESPEVVVLVAIDEPPMSSVVVVDSPGSMVVVATSEVGDKSNVVVVASLVVVVASEVEVDAGTDVELVVDDSSQMISIGIARPATADVSPEFRATASVTWA